MTTHINIEAEAPHPLIWTKTYAWLEAFVTAFDYDPIEQTATSVAKLRNEIKTLNARLDLAENRPGYIAGVAISGREIHE